MTARPNDDELELNAYVDGELDPMRALAFERKLAASPALERRHQSMLNLRASLRAAMADDERAGDRTADGLVERIAAALAAAGSQPAAASRPPPARPPPARTGTWGTASGRAGNWGMDNWGMANWRAGNWRALAASFVVGAGLASFATLQVADRGNAPATADILVAGHMRSLLAAEPIDVASSDRHTVKPWFASRVAQSPDVFDLSADGFALVGGRIDVIGRRPVATIVYRRAQHLVSLTMLDAAQARPANISIAGYHTRTWADGDVVHVAVSDLPEADLVSFERSFRAAAAAAAPAR